jgi:pimeloyl-ACP methyl ester carboxylesterase
MNGVGVRRRAWHILPVVIAGLMWFAALPALAATSGTFSSPAPCPNVSLKLQLGTTTPVLLVHGFNEGPGVFTTGSPSLESAIVHGLGGAVRPVTFDYSKWNTQWVTTVPIGPQLAQCITWLAQTSDTQGGPGKVIIVAHSMGGLAVRCAVDPACVKGNQAADPSLISLVITLGTPNTGSTLGNFASFVTSGYQTAIVHVKPTGPVESIEAQLCQQLPQCPQVAAAITTPAAKDMQIGSAALNPDTLKPLPSSIPLDAIAGKIALTTSLMDAGRFTIPINVGDVGDLVVPVASAQDPQGPPHPGPGNWQPTIDCGSIPIDSLPEWVAGKLAGQQSLVKCWHVTETTDPAWQSDIITAIKPAEQALSLIACTPAALTKGLVAANPQLNGYSWKLASSACRGGWAVAEVYAPAVGNGTAFLRRTTSGWSSAPLGEVNCSVIPGPLGPPLPPHSLAVSLVDKAGFCGSAGTSQFAGVPAGYDKYTNLRYGFTLFWPSSFRAQPPAQNGDGQTWTSPGGQVLLSAYGTNNASNYSPVQDEAIDSRSMSVIYKNISGNVVIVSGYENSGRTITYQRDVVGPGAIDTLYWSYPASQKARWDAAVTLTGQAFQPGNITTTH